MHALTVVVTDTALFRVPLSPQGNAASCVIQSKRNDSKKFSSWGARVFQFGFERVMGKTDKIQKGKNSADKLERSFHPTELPAAPSTGNSAVINLLCKNSCRTCSGEDTPQPVDTQSATSETETKCQGNPLRTTKVWSPCFSDTSAGRAPCSLITAKHDTRLHTNELTNSRLEGTGAGSRRYCWLTELERARSLHKERSRYGERKGLFKAALQASVPLYLIQTPKTQHLQPFILAKPLLN